MARGSIFRRATMRAQRTEGAYFIPPGVQRLPVGTDEMSVVALVRMERLATPADPLRAQGIYYTGDAGVTDSGMSMNVSTGGGGGNNLPYFAAGDGGNFPLGFGRQLAAADVGRVHRFVGTCSAANNLVAFYLNSKIGSFTSPIAAYVPDNTFQAVLANRAVSSPSLFLYSLLDLAIYQDAAFTAAEVADLDKAILASGRIPPGWANWDMYVSADRLIQQVDYLDAGGRLAGAGIEKTGNGGFDTLIRSSCLIEPSTWGAP